MESGGGKGFNSGAAALYQNWNSVCSALALSLYRLLQRERC